MEMGNRDERLEIAGLFHVELIHYVEVVTVFTR